MEKALGTARRQPGFVVLWIMLLLLVAPAACVPGWVAPYQADFEKETIQQHKEMTKNLYKVKAALANKEKTDSIYASFRAYLEEDAPAGLSNLALWAHGGGHREAVSEINNLNIEITELTKKLKGGTLSDTDVVHYITRVQYYFEGLLITFRAEKKLSGSSQ